MMSERQAVTGPFHTFHAVAFVENLALKELAPSYPEATRTPHELWFTTPAGGTVFIYPFGAMVFQDVSPPDREMQLKRLLKARPGLTTTQVMNEEFSVRVDPGARPDMKAGVLVVDQLTFERSSVVALTVAQSAAMDYYDRIVERMFVETDKLVERLEKRGTPPAFTRPLHRFIGQAMGVRNEVLSILHLLDKPDSLWEDQGADRVYQELRSEFDLTDRYQSLELKLRSIQEALELILDVARDRKLTLLEGSIVALIVFEIILSFTGK